MTGPQYGFATLYSSLSVQEQISFLLNAIYNISLEGRGTYVPGGYGLSDPERLRIINEALHRLSGHGFALLKNSQPRRTDEDVVKLLLEITHNLKLDSRFFDEALDKS